MIAQYYEFIRLGREGYEKVHEAAYRTADVAGQRRTVRAALDLKPGEDVLDIGSGPGFLVLMLTGPASLPLDRQRRRGRFPPETVPTPGNPRPSARSIATRDQECARHRMPPAAG